MIFYQNQIYIIYVNIYDQDCKTETELNLPQLQTRYFLSIHLRSSRASWEEGHGASFRVSSATSCITTRGRRSHSPPPRLSWVILTLQQLNHLEINKYWDLKFSLNLHDVETYQAVFEAARIELVEWTPHLDTDTTISLKTVPPVQSVSSRTLRSLSRFCLPQNTPQTRILIVRLHFLHLKSPLIN